MGYLLLVAGGKDGDWGIKNSRNFGDGLIKIRYVLYFLHPCLLISMPHAIPLSFSY